MRYAIVLMLCLAGCGGASQAPIMLPAPVSPNPVPGNTFEAGFAKVDITPAPGMGLSGNAFEGQQARAYSQRLYARAVVLEGVDGERIAYLVTDLPHISAVLHRLTAERTLRGPAQIGADRLILSATHTHSSVANHYTNSSYNRQSGLYSGYDQFWVAFVVERLARAVEQAYADLKPSRAGWSLTEVKDVTLNRSLDAYRANPPSPLGIVHTVVDDTLYTLRIDHCDGAVPPTCAPRGAFAVFAIHGTGFPTSGDVMNPDIQGVVQRAVEREIDRNNNIPDAETRFRPEATYVLANGTEGDVTPSRLNGTRCERNLRQRPGARPGGPRWSPPPPEVWQMSQDDLHNCLARARDSVTTLGKTLGDSAISGVLDNAPGASAPTIRRAFTTIHLPTYPQQPPICPSARFGTANVGGAPTDGQTRLLSWSPFWFLNLGFEGGRRSVVNPPHGCQGAKRVGLGFFLQGLVVGPHGFPEYAQMSVVQVGDLAIVSLPWEVTTEAGRRIKRAVQDASGGWAKTVAVIGLANGYFQYLTTAEEYSVQAYEGGSNIYGPNTLSLVVDVVSDLTRNIGSVARVDPIAAYVGEYRTYFRRLPTVPKPVTRRFRKVSCKATALIAEWVDAAPGQFQPSAGQVLAITQNGAPIAWDDHAQVEVRAVRSLGGDGFLWRVTYRPDVPLNGTYTIELLARPGVAAGPSGRC